MTTYRVIRKPITQTDGPDYEPGDEWEEPPESVISAFGDRLEQLDESADEDDVDATVEGVDAADETPAEEATAEEDSAEQDQAEENEPEEADEDDVDETSGDGFDVDEFIDQNAADQKQAIEAGEVDSHLDAIEAANAETNEYVTVQQAIDGRREE